MWTPTSKVPVNAQEGPSAWLEGQRNPHPEFFPRVHITPTGLGLKCGQRFQSCQGLLLSSVTYTVATTHCILKENRIFTVNKQD
jgi:hypothetical protein